MFNEEIKNIFTQSFDEFESNLLHDIEVRIQELDNQPRHIIKMLSIPKEPANIDSRVPRIERPKFVRCISDSKIDHDKIVEHFKFQDILKYIPKNKITAVQTSENKTNYFRNRILTRKDRVARWKLKRKLIRYKSNKLEYNTHRIAAKSRNRIKGRFKKEFNYVSVN